MSKNAQSGCGRGEIQYAKEIHFLHSFPGLFPNYPQFAREKQSATQHNNVQYTHSEKNLFTYYIIASSSFTFSYIIQLGLLLLILKKQENLLTMVHTCNYAVPNILTGKVLYLCKRSLQTDKCSFINVRNAIIIQLKYRQYLDNVHVDKN